MGNLLAQTLLSASGRACLRQCRSPRDNTHARSRHPFLANAKEH